MGSKSEPILHKIIVYLSIFVIYSPNLYLWYTIDGQKDAME